MFSKCAQQTPLSGGKKDVVAPQLDTNKVVQPPNGSINFSAERIVIPFNEFVKLKDKDKQILITPFLETTPNIYVKGKKVIVDFKAPLDDNTTYIINFGNSIVDITEGNEVVNYKYVFSTGSYIDSLTYDAAVYDAFQKTPVEGAYVMLYKTHEDSVLTKEKPNYFGITNGSGTCHIENIASGNYKVVAFTEDNNNYKWDAKKEKIGFLESRFNADQDSIQDTLVIFNNLPKELKVVEANITTSGKGWIAFNQPLKQGFNFSKDSVITSFSHEKTTRLNSTRDSIFFFTKPSFLAGDKLSIGIENATRKVTIPAVEDTLLSFKTNASRGLKPNEDLSFKLSQPIANIDESRIDLKLDDISIPFQITQEGNDLCVVRTEWEMGENYEITLLPGAFTSYKSLTNDTIGALFETHEENDFGQLNSTIKCYFGGFYMLELLKDGKVQYRDFVDGEEFTMSYPDLFPGNYSLRVIFDENYNGIWDTGDYFDHLQPERVEYYSDPIQIKKGWDMEIEWEILE